MGYITKNFKPSEFECPDCGMINIKKDIVFVAQDLADRASTRIKVLSASRCKKHNEKIYNDLEITVNNDTLHRYGGALDLAPLDCNFVRFVEIAKKMYQDGRIKCLIIYWHKKFIHIDNRDVPYYKEIGA